MRFWKLLCKMFGHAWQYNAFGDKRECASCEIRQKRKIGIPEKFPDTWEEWETLTNPDH